MTALTVEQSRAQFEVAMAKKFHWGTKRSYLNREADAYQYEMVDSMWTGWELHRRTVSEGERCAHLS
jgi:hypothetical protein